MPSPPSSDGSTSRAAVALAVLAVLAASFPATAVTDVESATTSGVTADRKTCPQLLEPTGEKGLPENATSPPTPNESADRSVARGDIATVPLSVPAGVNVTVRVGSDDGYSTRLDVRDDGDGRVRLLVNTYLAGNRTTVAPGTYRTAGTDAVVVTGGTPTDPLEPGTYPVTATRNGTVVAERELTVTEPSFESITARRAVPRLFDASNASAIRAANRSGLTAPLEPGEYDPEAVEGETLLVRIDAPSLLGAIAARSGNTTTDRFLALHEETEPETDETFEISGPCGGILFRETATEGGARVLLDYRAGAAYVLLDTTTLEGTHAGGQTVYVEVSPESRLGDAGRELTTSFRIATRQTAVRPSGADTVRLTADDRATISGETNLLADSRVPVRVESRVDSTFERRTTATVTDNGTFTATVDLANASVPGLFAVHVGPDQFPGETGESPGVYWKLSEYGHRQRVTDLNVRQLTLPEGGFLVAYEYDSSADRFRPVGSATPSDDDLVVDSRTEPGYLLVVAHRDANGNRAFDGPATDSPYRVDDRVVSDWLGVTVDGVEPTGDEPSATFDADRAVTPPTETPTADPDTTTTDPDTIGSTVGSSATIGTAESTGTTPTTADAGSTTPSDATGVGTPGFGPVVAAAALLGATALRLGTRR
ncbi:BGTF surface domain-containing protein [Halorussus aquaticus]|uniref:BGTF surface domain-containing protein n=1 Tax=Halorussus aquaticus TaxID=2953748 RepID=A0ABD5Q7P9_9EURY|nr:BGTF surface domain-containing protein [Halorussus aquaticus]